MDSETADLTLRLSRGEEEAFAFLYDREGSAMYRVALTICGSPAVAEDAVQDVFLALVRARERLASVTNLRGYVFAALRRAAAYRAESAARHTGADVEPDSLPRAAEDHDDRLGDALHGLPREQREVIALKVDGGLTFADIGETLSISPNTAASRYRYAIEKLREALERGE